MVFSGRRTGRPSLQTTEISSKKSSLSIPTTARQSPTNLSHQIHSQVYLYVLPGWKHRLETFTECFQQELFIFETFNDQLYQKNDIVPAIITLSWRIYRILLLGQIILRYTQVSLAKNLKNTIHFARYWTFFQFKILRKPEGMFNVN